MYQAHRLAWLYMHGEWPVGDLDHINGDPADNRIANLRIATQSQNNANRRARRGRNKGVYMEKKTGKYKANICVNRKQIYLGRFESAEAAKAAYDKAAAQYFGEYARTG
jgi:hypothetical protein